MKSLRAVLGILLGVIARAWLGTLRVRLEMSPELASEGTRDVPWVYAFLHGAQWAANAVAKRKPAVVLVSLSKDGEIQARALPRLGLHVVRGSSSKSGARGLRALVRRMREESVDAAFAVDGPKGPYGLVKPGVVAAAALAGAALVPVGTASARAIVLARAWDRFEIAWPFSRVAVVVGAPIFPGKMAEKSPKETRNELEAAIHAATVRARALLQSASSAADDDTLAVGDLSP